MFFKRALIGLAAVAAVASAHAVSLTSLPEGSLGTNPTTGFYAGVSPVDSIASYSFILGGIVPSTYSLSLSFSGVFGNLDLTSVSLAKLGGGTTSFVPTGFTGSFSGLTAGQYALSFNFTPASSGLFAGSLTTVSSPVPEAESTALALAGVGVVGLLAARRRKAA